MKQKSKKREASKALSSYEAEMVTLAELKPHPRNYRAHPEDQLEHICESLRQNGWYRNIVVARDNTILAGHGVVLAAQKLKYKQGPAVRLDIASDSPQALKLVAADNELGRFAEDDDRALAEMLRQIHEECEEGLKGTGYDEQALMAFLMVTRPSGEISDANEAAEWVGMPDYDNGEEPFRLMVMFKTEKDREKFIQKVGFKVVTNTGKLQSTRWPIVKQKDDMSSTKFVQAQK